MTQRGDEMNEQEAEAVFCTVDPDRPLTIKQAEAMDILIERHRERTGVDLLLEGLRACGIEVVIERPRPVLVVDND
jgi:hypothetical protein